VTYVLVVPYKYSTTTTTTTTTTVLLLLPRSHMVESCAGLMTVMLLLLPGVTTDSRLTMENHVSTICCLPCLLLSTASPAGGSAATLEVANSLLHAFISGHLNYCNALLYDSADCQLQ